MQMKSQRSIHSVCIFPVKYTFWPAERYARRNSVLWKITADLLLWAPVCLAGCSPDTAYCVYGKNRSIPILNEKSLSVNWGACTAHVLFVSSKWKWSTCFVASVCCKQQQKRPNYEQDEPGLCVGGVQYLFPSLSFHCSLYRYCLWDVNMCVWGGGSGGW